MIGERLTMTERPCCRVERGLRPGAEGVTT